jgi:hypothetical protein
MRRPDSLTEARAMACMAQMEPDPEWERRQAAGLNPPGMLGLRGCMRTVFPEEKFTEEEARYILALQETHSLRALAEDLTGDDNQCFGIFLVDAARHALPNA